MFDDAVVIGTRGRVGSAVSARLRERGVTLREEGAGLVLALRPRPGDRRGRRLARAGPVGRARERRHAARGARPHRRRFSVHPLQTFTNERGPEQLDGAWAAVTGESPEAITTGVELAELLGLRPFVLADERRALYHAGAAMASNYLVTLRRAAGELLAAADVPAEALEPADAARDRERLPADRADRARRLGDGRAPSHGDRGRGSRAARCL